MERVKEVERKLEANASDCFNKLYNISNENKANSGPKEISLEKIAFYLTLYGEKIPKEYKDIILQYNLVNNIMDGKIKNGVNPEVFTETKFKDFLSGKELKETLFNSTLIEKKDKVELLTKLFYVLGGDSNGISKDKLAQAISKFYSMFNVDTRNGELINKQTDEVIELLGDNGNNISLNDFINIMTSDLTFDDVLFDEILGPSNYTNTPSNIRDSNISNRGGNAMRTNTQEQNRYTNSHPSLGGTTTKERKKYENTTTGEPVTKKSEIEENDGFGFTSGHP
jgi:hypothetical protein